MSYRNFSDLEVPPTNQKNNQNDPKLKSYSPGTLKIGFYAKFPTYSRILRSVGGRCSRKTAVRNFFTVPFNKVLLLYMSSGKIMVFLRFFVWVLLRFHAFSLGFCKFCHVIDTTKHIFHWCLTGIDCVFLCISL